MIYTDSEFLNSIALFFYDHLPDMLNLNLTASIVILFVICVRQFLKGAPKIFSYALWGIVLLRLLVPVSIESPMSFVPERTEFTSMVDVNEALPEIEFQTAEDRLDNKRQMEISPTGDPMVLSHSIVEPQHYLTMIWIAGMLFLSVRSILAYLGLRERVKVSVLLQKGVYIADDIDTPFVMGIFRPRIYLPGTLDSTEQKYIIAHERHHIRRGDHIFKALGFLALTIHWFNPFVWVAFVLAGRDMEMSCDEAVIRKLGEDVRAEYSASLLNLATGKRMFAGTPLAFDEGDPTERVRNLARWKKPKCWIILICVLVCVVLAVCLLTDPEITKPMELSQETAQIINIVMYNDPLPEGYFESRDDKGNIIITDGINTVGGVICYSIPEGIYNPDDHIESLLYKMGIPDYMDSILYYLGGISTWDNNGWVAEFQSDVAEGETPSVHRRHHFYPIGDYVYDIWFDMTQVEYEKTEEIRVCMNLPEGAPIEMKDWGVSIKPDRVSRTGATALFVYSGSIPGEEGAELTYGDFLSLDRMVDGNWVPCDELAGYEHFVGDASYPVVDGYGMVHEWPDRFGELSDGHYRLGKQLTLTCSDGSSEERMVYGEFSIPDSIQVGPIPLEELPENYSAEQAAIDGCLVCPDGNPRDNIEAFLEFAEACMEGQPGQFRIVHWYYGEDPHYIAEDIIFDGNNYTVKYIESNIGIVVTSPEYPYLKHFTGEKEEERFPYDAYDHYVLVKDNDITWQEIFDGKYQGNWRPIFQNYIYYPKKPQMPANPMEATLEFNGELLVTTTDFDRLEKIWILFEEAELLGYEPKTHSIGASLNLILTSKSGETMTIELDPDSDICRINGEYVFYGAYDEPDYIEKLWYYLGIPQWPDVVYENCQNALKP